MKTVRYYFLQYMPDYSSREALNWGLIFLAPVNHELSTLLAVYDNKGERLMAAIPWYDREQHQRAIAALTQYIQSIQGNGLPHSAVLRGLQHALPLGHRIVKGGSDPIPRDWQRYIDDMYAYYVARGREHRPNADAFYGF